ncbi:Uncharacterized protein FWK35_00035599 [Aphis craccivora]|uniref:DDE Tnp4 domain-containing protein n=1 Tax=Aphis craccivora TaxID=307492 RepID=A0A6G0VLI3_APHCR|nr:Uncharacterized protein FWK35_00035599 [Aphis craccivora]
MDRYQRAQKRQKVLLDNILHSVGIQDHCDCITTSTDEGNNLMNQFKEVSTQVTFENSVNKNFLLQSSVQYKSCSPDSLQVDSYLSCNKFHGFDCIKDEKQLKDLTGVTFKVFNLLISFLSDSNKNLLDIKNVLCSKTKNFIFWPDKYSITQTLPNSFKINYPNCRYIIDCTEIKVEQPSTVEQCVYLYSSYKSYYTVKTLVAGTANGMITFLSECYGGRTSDSFLTNDSLGFWKIMPPIPHNCRFSEEVLETYSVASVRIHIERGFARLK